MTYGNASSPYVAVKCLFYLAEEVESEHPCTSKVIKRDFYMDDLLTGSNSQEEILELQKIVSSILRSAGFSLRKWLCNDNEILKKFELDESLDASMIHIGQGEQNKTLGIYWDSNNDLICYKINVPNMLNVECLSKRAILSIICQIFDPLGLLGPLIIRAKIVIQDLWKHKVGWDEKIPQQVLESWSEFYRDLDNIGGIRIPRHAMISGYVDFEIHGFCDASNNLRVSLLPVALDGVGCKFIMWKV